MRRFIGILIVVVVGIALYRYEGGTPSPPATAPTPLPAELAVPLVDKSEAAQQKRRGLIEQLIAERVFQKTEMPGELPRLWTGPRFDSLEFDMKESFTGVVYAYYLDGSDPSASVRIFDGRTGREIGTYSTAGLSLD